MHLRSVFSATTVLALLVAVPAQAAVILELGPVVNLEGGLISRTVTAVGNAGEVIAGFDGVNIENAHHVWGLGDVQTPRIGSFPGFGWNAAWAPYDTHLLVPSSAVLGSVGAALAETNAKGTTGTLGLPQEFGQNAPSGFGTIKSADGTDGFRLLPELQGSSVAFMHVVTTPQTAFLDVSVAYTSGGSNLAQIFADFEIKGGTVVIPPVVGDLNLVANNVNEVVGGTVAISDVTTLAFDAIAAPMFTPTIPGKPLLLPNPPTLSNTGVFSWNTSGSLRGEYKWAITGTGTGTDGGVITVQVNGVPEPATLSMLGLAIVGLVGCARRRS